MLYTLTIDELLNDPKFFENFRLCYVDTIPQTYTDYTPESKKLMETDEYKEYVRKRREYLDKLMKEQGHYSSWDINKYDHENDSDRKFETEMMEYPHPDFTAGYTHYLYFTSDIDNQWGDDWDDAPYEYNAGKPYYNKTDVLIIPVTFPTIDFGNYDDEFCEKLQKRFPNMGNVDIKFPCDYGLNSPFCVININQGAVAWIFATNGQHGIAIGSNDNPVQALMKIEKIHEMTI